jgi:hypothetical protein
MNEISRNVGLNPVQKCLSEYQKFLENSMAKYAQNGLRMHLLQSRISKCSGGGPPYSPPTSRALQCISIGANNTMTAGCDNFKTSSLTIGRVLKKN